MTHSAENIVSGASLVSAELPTDMTLDGRRPIRLDHHGHVLEVIAGHLDIFAVDVDGDEYGSRHHLFRIERLPHENVEDFARSRNAFTGDLRVVNIEFSLPVAPVAVVLEKGG